MADIISAWIDGGVAAFITNPGNLGDALIRAGARSFLRRAGIKTRAYSARLLRDLHRQHFAKGYAAHVVLKTLSFGALSKYPLTLSQLADRHEVAIICGSGGFCREVAVAAKIVRLAARHFRRVIVLPSTYAIPLADYPAHVTFFARDRLQSVHHAEGRAHFCHDMAFALNPRPVMPVQRLGVHLRTDKESSGRLPVVPGNLDISAQGTERESADRVFEAVGRSEVVVTDRLHLGIAAALLGRQTFLFPGSYFKIPAIFESSIQPHYPHVRLVHAFDELPHEVRPDRMGLARLV